MTYTDVVNIYGVCRAGFIPQLFSLRLPNPTVIYELLQRGNAQALIFEPSFENIVQDPPVPVIRAATLEDHELYADESLPELMPFAEDDIVCIFHTSGSTSGSPKLVPCTGKWIDSAVTKAKESSAPAHRNSLRQDVSTWM